MPLDNETSENSKKTAKSKNPKKLQKKHKIAILLLIIICVPTFTILIWFNPLVIKSLPDVLLFNDGSKVTTQSDWELRRDEIKDLLQTVEYGHMPDRPDALNVSIDSVIDLGDGESLNLLTLSIIPNNATPQVHINFTVWQFIPSGTGPFPCLIKVGSDGFSSEDYMNQTVLNRGYAYVCYDHIALDPDTKGYDEVGACQEIYLEYDWGTIAVWAWGAMRVVDFLESELWVNSPEEQLNVDPGKLIIAGHSRRGKTALFAAAFDERIEMAVPNGSGCCGAGSFLVQGLGSETIAFITAKWLYKSWFQEDFDQYAFRERDLTFDQHFIRSLIAPRLIITTDGLSDYWANPIGTQVIWNASNEVFQLYGVAENNAIHYREGGHGFLESDFNTLLDFADKMMMGKTISGDFYMTPFDIELP